MPQRYPYQEVMAATRLTVRKRAAAAVPALSAITRIDDDALEAWRQQWLPAIDAAKDMPGWSDWSDWDWGKEMQRSSLGPKRFDMAIWSGGQLCGLALGRTSPKRNNFSVYVMQSVPVVDHPLKGHIIPIVIDISTSYGTALQCRELRFLKPLTGMIPVYERFRFELVRTSQHVQYCRRSL